MPNEHVGIWMKNIFDELDNALFQLEIFLKENLYLTIKIIF